jgi:antitoxin MazE
MKMRITKWGNSLGIRIPKLFAVHLGVAAGKEVDVEYTDNTIVISRPSDTSLDLLLADVTSENSHGETDTSAPSGREIW